MDWLIDGNEGYRTGKCGAICHIVQIIQIENVVDWGSNLYHLFGSLGRQITELIMGISYTYQNTAVSSSVVVVVVAGVAGVVLVKAVTVMVAIKVVLVVG